MKGRPSQAIRKRRPDVQKGAYYEGLVGTRCAEMNVTSAGTNIMARTSHIATCDIRRLKIACPNYKVPSNTDGAELAAGTTSTITASVEYPAGVFSQILFAGQVQASIASMSLRESDYCTPAQMIPIGATFWIRQFYTGSIFLYADGNLIGGLNADSALGDILNSNSPTPIDRTMGGTIPQENAGRVTFPPSAIIGVTNKPSVIVVGDSSARGLHDVSGVKDGRAGTICRAFPATTLAFLNHASASAGAADTNITNSYLLWSPARRTLWKYATHLIDQLGARDLYYGSDNAATIEFSCRTNIWSHVHPRAKIIRSTIYMISTSSDLWATAGNQTPSPFNSEKNVFNNKLRTTGLAGVTDYWEIAWALEDAHDNGKWKSDGSPQTYTDDGLHPVGAVGNNQAATAIDMSKIYWP